MRSKTFYNGAHITAILCAVSLLLFIVACSAEPDVPSSDSTSDSTLKTASTDAVSYSDQTTTFQRQELTSLNTTTTATRSSGTAATRPTDSLNTGGDEGGMPSANLKGYTFTIADCTRYGDYSIPEAGTSSQADGWWKMIDEIQDKLNCKIKYEFYDPTSSAQTITTKLLGGAKVADILVAPQFSIGSYITAGFLQDLNKVPNLNLKANYWYRSIIDSCTIGGKTYAIAGDYNNYAGKLCGFYYNKRLIKELGLTDPYELVKQNKWDFATFRSMALAATKDLNGDGKMTAKDQYGIVGTWIYDQLYAANGCRKLSTDKKGRVAVSLTSAKSVETLNWIHDLMYKDRVIMDLGVTVNNMSDVNIWIKYFNQFTDGKALFLGCPVMDMMYSREIEDDFGFVVCPKGPNANSYSSFIEVNANMIGVFTTNKDLEKTGTVLEAIGYLGHYLSDAYVSDDVYLTLFRGDDHSLEMLKLALNNVVFDIGEFEAVDGLIHDFREVLRTANVDIQAKLSAKSGSWTAEVNKIFNK